MAGDFYFTNRTWTNKTSAAFYVTEYLVSRLPQGAEQNEIQSYIDNNLPVLELAELDCELVHLAERHQSAADDQRGHPEHSHGR
jgi:hypothetical protein